MSTVAANKAKFSLSTAKQHLKANRTQLLALHHNDAPIDQVVAATSKLADDLLTQIWPQHFGADSALSLLAVGGYGRSELNLHSDIDLLLLSQRALDKTTAYQAEQFIQFLWDLGLEVGHSVRSLNQCIKQAKSDVGIMTNLLEARLLIGDQKLHEALQQTIRKQSVWPNKAFFAAKVTEQQTRHANFEDTAYKLEPNLKGSPGGLRDIQTISWMANRIFGHYDIESSAVEGFLEQGELQSLIDNRRLLWRLRNSLHALSGRCEDRLLFNYQTEIATQFGLSDNPEQRAIEQLMQQYYRAAKETRRLNEFLLQQIEDSFSTQKPKILKCRDGRFEIINGHLRHKEPQLFTEQPNALLDAFAIYQRDERINDFSAATVRAIRANLHLIDDHFRSQPDNLSTFLGIFRHDKSLTRTLRKLDTYGVLGRFLPVYGRIAGQMQHDLFHAFTVDAHSLLAVRNLRRFAQPKYHDEFPELNTVMQTTNSRHCLYLAGLFHDIAKGRGGDHHSKGAVDARNYCTQLRMPPEEVELVAWLVLNHLQMSKVSQREDLSDSEVIDNFAELVGNQSYLDHLYLLTVADICATSATTWTAWKGHLLSQLYNKTTRAFGNAEQERVVDNNVKIERRKKATSELLNSKVPTESLERFWTMLDDEYVLSHRPATMAWHGEQICSASALDMPVVDARYLEEYEAQQYFIYTADSPYIVPTITEAFDQRGQNIVQAKIHSANPGFTILLFTVTALHKEHAPQKAQLSEDADWVRNALVAPHSQSTPKKRFIPRAMKQFDFEPEISIIVNDGQGTLSVNLVALDQPGLIHKISNVFAQCQVKLVSANITTVGEKVEDSFVVAHPAKDQALDAAEAKTLKAALAKALENL